MPPLYIIENADAIFVLEETKTSSPFFIPTAKQHKCKAFVPLLTAILNLDLFIFPNSSSNFLMNGPPV